MSRHVLVYAPQVLAPSGTFIADQARSLTRWSPALVGRERVDRGLPVQDLLAPEMFLATAAPSRQRRLIQQVTRRVPVLRDVAARQPPDLIHAHFLTGGFDVFGSLRPPPCPVVVTAHGFDATWHGSPPHTFRPQQWLHGALRHRLLRRRVHLVAVSRFIRDRLIRLGASEDQVLVHYTGVDVSRFTPTPDGSIGRRGVLFVGRLVAQKGVIDLLRAAVVLQAEGLDAPIEVIGDGPERRSLERFAAAARLDVSFRGVQPRSEVITAMRRAAILCSPSRAESAGDCEGFGMVLVEAQATGLPVVATATGGMVEAVDDGRTGLLVPERRPRALVAALRACLVDEELHHRLSGAARPWVVNNFDLEVQTSVLEDHYDAWASGLR